MSKRNNAHYIFASKINWLNYQLSGAQGNIRSATYQIMGDPSIKQMKPDYTIDLQLLLSDLRRLTYELDNLRAQIAAFNKKPNKYKITEKPSRPQ